MWVSAVSQYRAGNDSGLRAALTSAGLSLLMLPVLKAALDCAAELQKVIDAAPTSAELQASENRKDRARVAAMTPEAKAEYEAATSESSKLWSANTTAHRSRLELSGLHAYFPQLFGGEQRAELPGNFRLPAAMHNALREVGIDPTRTAWTDHGKTPEQIQAASGKPRRFRESPMNGPEPGTLDEVIAQGRAANRH